MPYFDKNPLYAGSHIRMYSGMYIDPSNPSEDDILLKDIAHGLAYTYRFGGNTKVPYSVAEHSIWMAQRAIDLGCDADIVIQCLMHDASEAYLCDLPAPIKELLPEYKEIENNLMECIARKFNFQWPVSNKVKQLDREALENEWVNVVLNEGFQKQEPETIKAWFVAIFRMVTALEKA